MGQSSLFVIFRNFQSGFSSEFLARSRIFSKKRLFPQRRLGAEQDSRVFPVLEGFPGTEGFSVPEEPGLSFPRTVVFPEQEFSRIQSSPLKRACSESRDSRKNARNLFRNSGCFSNKTRTFPLFLFQLRGFCGIIAADRVRQGRQSRQSLAGRRAKAMVRKARPQARKARPQAYEARPQARGARPQASDR